MAVDAPTRVLPRLSVIGVYNACEAYPNTLYSLRELRREFDLNEINVPLLPSDGGVMRLRDGLFSSLCKVVSTHFRVIVKGVMLRPRPKCIFVPYPSPILLYIWSFVPKFLRPRRIVADAFISLYDTVVNDRGLFGPADWRARLLWHVERRAYGIATAVIVDTCQNADFYASLLRLSRNLFIPIPLATNERDFSPALPSVRCGVCNVLFIGTLIPLHGISTIVDAARILAGRHDIRFTIIGNGQDASIVESALNDSAINITWERDWKTPSQLAASITQANICLGIFGAGQKTQRVCPYKIYAYASIGRPVITAHTAWLSQAAEEFGGMPFLDVPAANAAALAAGIIRLADDEVLCAEMAKCARQFYDDMLANRIAFARLRANLTGEAGS